MNETYSLQTEKAIIGTLLVNGQEALTIIDQLKSEYFFDESHRLIIKAMIELVQSNKPTDLALTYEQLRKNGDNNKMGELEGLRQNLDYAERLPQFLPIWIEEIKGYWEKRTIVKICTDIASRARMYSHDKSKEYRNYAEEQFMSLHKMEEVNKGLVSSVDIFNEKKNKLLETLRNPEKFAGIKTGFTRLDNFLKGLHKSNLITIGARPGVGKTSFALNIAHNVSSREKKNVAFFSFEMSSDELMSRYMALRAKVNCSNIITGDLTAEETLKIKDVTRELKNENLFIDDRSTNTVFDIASECRKLKKEKGSVDLVIIDYLQLISSGPTNKFENREREIAKMSWNLKLLSKELDCPVIILSQLNRESEKRDVKRPKSSDLRESGAIEQDSSLILFIYREEMHDANTEKKGIAEIIIGKNRNGPTGTIELGFNSEFTLFEDL